MQAKEKGNTGVDENRVGPTIGSGSFKMTFIRCWSLAHKSPVKRNLSKCVKSNIGIKKGSL